MSEDAERTMHETFLRLPAVMAMTGLSRTTIWRHERAGDFPRRRRIAAGCVAWLESELREWMQNRPTSELAPFAWPPRTRANDAAGSSTR